MFVKEALNYAHTHEAKIIPPHYKRLQHIKVLTCFPKCTKGNHTPKVTQRKFM